MKKHVTLIIIALCYFSQIGFSQINCPAPSAHDNINTNNINAKTSNGGYLFRDGGGNFAAFQVPYANAESPATIFAAGLWLGGFTGLPFNPILKLTSVDYGSGQNGYLPGPLSDVGSMFSATSCEDFNKIWTVTKTEIQLHILDFEDNGIIDNPNSNIVGFPCKDNPNFLAENGFPMPMTSDGLQHYARFFDQNGDGIYNAMDGDYPTPLPAGDLIPSQMSWSIFNDLGNVGGNIARLEIQLTTWSVECPLAPILDNTIFTSYRVTNRGPDPIDSLHVGMWVDFDLGCYTDDFIGCNPDLNTFYAYNQDETDGDVNGACQGGVSTYSTQPPVQAVTFMDTDMQHFMTYQNAGIGAPPPPITDPSTPPEMFNYLSGSWRDGTPLTEGGSGYNPSSTNIVDHIFPGDPNESSEWSLESILSDGGDIRAIASTGKSDFGIPNPDLSFHSQEVFETTIAWSFHQGDGQGRLENVTLMFEEVEQLKSWYDNYGNSTNSCAIISSDDNIDFTTNISLFPNPNNGTFELEFLNEELSQIQVFDVSGKLIWEKVEDIEGQITIHLQNAANGIYFLKGKTANGFFYEKFVIGE